MARPRSQPNRQREYHIPAPIGGVNSVSAGTEMPPADCIQSNNLIGAEYGLRSRLGWREWATGLVDDAGVKEEVRSILPFTGTLKDGTGNRLFAACPSGIWDCSSSTPFKTAGQRTVNFPVVDADSGWGVSTVFVTLAGHFLIYADEANGLYTYSESNTTWVKVVQAASVAWVTATLYAVNDYVQSSGVTYICTTGGTSGATAPTGTGTGISDDVCVWNYAPAISGVDPAKVASVTAWKNRLWLVERDTGNGYYLETSAIYGTAHKFQFGNRFKNGGDLRGLWSYTRDGGEGMDDLLVAISGGGDVLVYQGTDPAEAGAFALHGVYFVGAVPKGRRLCTEYGGDLLIMSTLGILPASLLFNATTAMGTASYRTAKIANLFNQAQIESAAYRGWAMRLHPQDSCLMVLSPTSVGYQFVMGLSTQGWHIYTGLEMGVCAEAWNGSLYYGTADGRVCVNEGYLDAVPLVTTWAESTAYVVGNWVIHDGITYECITAGTSDASAAAGPGGTSQDITDGTVHWKWNLGTYAAVEWSLLTSFTNLGSIRHKRIHSIRVRTLTKGENTPLIAEARYGFDFAPIAGSPTASGTAGSVWDAAVWDQSIWMGASTPAARVFGAYGIGAEVAVAVKGESLSRTTLVALDVTWDLGGVL